MAAVGPDGKPARPEPARRGGPFRHAGSSARKIIGEAAARHGFAEPDILLRWSEIMGEALGAVCVPRAVRYGRSQAQGATLIVETPGARAPEVEHLSPRIIERVNQFYGYRAVTRLRVMQTGGAPTGFAEGQTAFDGPATTAEPTKADLDRARAMTQEIETDALRDAMTRFGAYVLAQDRKTRTDPTEDTRKGRRQ